jgi:hypothetical protein
VSSELEEKKEGGGEGGREGGRAYPYVDGLSVLRAGQHDLRGAIPTGDHILRQVLREGGREEG